MKILYLQYTNPAGYPPLEHSSRILADLGWDVLFLGVGAIGTKNIRFPDHPRITVRQMPSCGPGWRQKVHFFQYFFWAVWTTIRFRPHWIYASDMFSGPAAVVASMLGPSLLYHEHDSPATQAEQSAFIRICLWIRGLCARKATLCVLPNKTRATVFTEQTRTCKPVYVVWNCPALSEVQSERKDTASAQQVRLFYHGSIVPERVPLTIIHAIARLPERLSLTIAGYETVGSKGHIQTMRELAEQLNVGAQFTYLGTIPTREGLLAECGQCNIGLGLLCGLSTDDINMSAMTGASNKPFDYLSCGLPLLVSNLPDWREMFVDSGFAIACNPLDAESIAGAIRQFLQDPARITAMGEAGRKQVLASWNYEAQFRPVLEVLQANSSLSPATISGVAKVVHDPARNS